VQPASHTEACFRAAVAPLAEQLIEEVREHVARAQPQRAAVAAIGALVRSAAQRPADARLLIVDSLAGGTGLRDARDELIDELARIIDAAHARLPPDAVVADLPPRLILGAACRLVAARLRRGEEPSGAGLADELVAWTAAYELPLARHRWHALGALPQPPRSPYLPPTALRAPPALAPGRPRTSTARVVENHWLRIVFATAETIEREGYERATVAQITEAAGVDTRAFYRLFAGKREALAAVNELLFRNAMAVAAGAFVAGATWPERVWEAARALTQYAEQNRTLTYVSLVESDAEGAHASPCVEQLAQAFTIFLLEGARDTRQRPAPSASCPSEVGLEAVGAAAYELYYRRARGDGDGAAAESSPLAQLVFIALAPFLGAEAAHDLLEHQTAPRRARAAHRSTRPPARSPRTAPGICT
jgi:AcrR family transcriptional regulator